MKSLTFIRRCREFGFSIDQVRSLVALMQDPASACVNARDLAQHLVVVRAKLAELRGLERSIAGFVASCNSSCAGGAGPDCVIFDDFVERLHRSARYFRERAPQDKDMFVVRNAQVNSGNGGIRKRRRPPRHTRHLPRMDAISDSEKPPLRADASSSFTPYSATLGRRSWQV